MKYKSGDKIKAIKSYSNVESGIERITIGVEYEVIVQNQSGNFIVKNDTGSIVKDDTELLVFKLWEMETFFETDNNVLSAYERAMEII